jgi:hypothetical protein
MLRLHRLANRGEAHQSAVARGAARRWGALRRNALHDLKRFLLSSPRD